MVSNGQIPPSIEVIVVSFQLGHIYFPWVNNLSSLAGIGCKIDAGGEEDLREVLRRFISERGDQILALREEDEPWVCPLDVDLFSLSRISSGVGVLSRDPGDYVVRWDPREKKMKAFIRRGLELAVLRIILRFARRPECGSVSVGVNITTAGIWRCGAMRSGQCLGIGEVAD